MLLGRVLVGHVARRSVIRVLLNNGSRRHLMPACSARFDQFQLNHLRRTMSSVPDPKIGQWSEEDLKIEPEKPKPEVHPLDAEKWTIVYRFRYIQPLRVLVRLKMYQAFVCLVTTAGMPVLRFFGIELAEDVMMITIGCNMYIFLATLALGHYGQQFVGLLYVNEPKDKIRVATLSFYGHRVDVMYDVQDVVHMSDMVQSDKAKFINLKSYADPKKNRFVYINDGIEDRELFEEVFGSLPETNRRRVTKFGKKHDS